MTVLDCAEWGFVRFLYLLNIKHGPGFTPEPVEVIEFALRRTEDMHNDIAVIEQEPAGIGAAFLPKRRDSLVFQAFFDFIEDGAELPLAFSGADNEIIRKAT